jgi:hypothetical protein
MQSADREALGRYAQLIAQCLRPAPVFQPAGEDGQSIQVERGLMLSMAQSEHPDLAGIATTCARLLEPGAAELRVVDAAGHQRPAYRGLLVYAWCRTLATIESFLTPAQASAWATAIERWQASLRASGGPVADAWAALAREDVDAVATFERLASQQQPGGALLKADPSRNPETSWFAELAILHALTAYAVRAGNAALQAAAHRAAEYHLSATQPDHATSEPWGLLAFILNPSTRSVADQMLHGVQVLYPRGVTGVTGILLADVRDCLRELSRDPR